MLQFFFSQFALCDFVVVVLLYSVSSELILHVTFVFSRCVGV